MSLIQEASSMRAGAGDAIRVSRKTREYVRPLLESMARGDHGFRAVYRHSMLLSVLDAAMEITGAEMGNVQVFDPSVGALRIEAQYGFGRPFLEFFDCVYDGQAACGTAFKCRRRVVVEDVADSLLFTRPRVLEVMLDAGVRAVQSIPLIGPSGSILGIVSTHRRKPGRPGDRELCVLDLLARNGAAWIEERADVICGQWHPPADYIKKT